MFNVWAHNRLADGITGRSYISSRALVCTRSLRLDQQCLQVCSWSRSTGRRRRALHMQFQNRSVLKTYLAIACGVPPEETFSVDAPVDRHDTNQVRIDCNIS